MPLAENGTRLAIQAVDFTTSKVNFVLVTSPTCKYCLASESFHTKLLTRSKRMNIPVYVVVPERAHAAPYLKTLAVNEQIVREYSQLNFSVAGTPTVLGLDEKGRVRAVWSGLATPSDEAEIAAVLEAKSFSTGKETTRIDAPDIQPDELSSLRAKRRLEVLDLRERGESGEHKDSLNIPISELPFRASHELDKTKLQVVDCTSVPRTQCKIAIETLKNLRMEVATLGAGTFTLRCKATPLKS